MFRNLLKVLTVLSIASFAQGGDDGERKLRVGVGRKGGGFRDRFPTQLVSTTPSEGSSLEDSTSFTAELLYPRQDRVEFLLIPPSGVDGEEVWLPGSLEDYTRNTALWTLDYEFDESGEWAYQVRCIDRGDNIDIITEPITFTVAGDGTEVQPLPPDDGGQVTLETIEMVKSSIIDLIDQDPHLSPKFVRLGFHDCVGGCDGCVDLTNVDNNGLERPINALNSVLDEFSDSGLSRADIWALAALTGAEVAQPNNNNAIEFPLLWVGRVDCENTETDCLGANGEVVPCSATRGTHRDLPPADLNTTGITHFFSQTFGFSPRETVALMGAHTIGTLSVANSGFPGQNGWVNQELRLDNEYYRQIVGGAGNDGEATLEDLLDAPNWNLRNQDNNNGLPDRFFWVRGGGGGGGGGGRGGGGGGGGGGRGNRRLQGGGGDPLVMLNADIALVRDFTDFLQPDGRVTCSFQFDNNNACPYAAMTLNFMGEYRLNNRLWVEDFNAVFTKMLNFGYDTSAGCPQESAPCVMPAM